MNEKVTLSMSESAEYIRAKLDTVRVSGRDVRAMADAMEVLDKLTAKLHAVDEAIAAEQKAQKEKAEAEALQTKREERERMLREAAERGEHVEGGQTVRINADGTVETIIE